MNHNLQIKKIVKNSLGPELSGHWKNRSVPSDFINNFHATVIILQEHQHLLFERKKKCVSEEIISERSQDTWRLVASIYASSVIRISHFISL
jgi:hypothetical protein